MKAKTATVDDAIGSKLTTTFLAALADLQAGKLKPREADQMYATLGVGRAAEANAIPLLRRAAVLTEIRQPGLTTLAVVLAAASPADKKAIADALKPNAVSA